MATRSKIFVSYSHRDREWLERLQVHLAPLVRSGAIDLWDDTRIESGDVWRTEIELALKETQVAILLVSADFLASDFIARDELPSLLAAAEGDGMRILPIILSASLFEESPLLSQFQAVNSPSQPLIGMVKADREALLEKVARNVHRLVSPPPTKTSSKERRRPREPPRAAKLPGPPQDEAPDTTTVASFLWKHRALASVVLAVATTLSALAMWRASVDPDRTPKEPPDTVVDVPANPCEPNPCGPGSCTAAGAEYECDCTGSGFGGDDCREDLDECALDTHDCSPNATCINTSGSFKCECNVGFSGDGIGTEGCRDDDPLALGERTGFLKNVRTNKCLTIPEGPFARVLDAEIRTCTRSRQQSFRIISVGESLSIRNHDESFCLNLKKSTDDREGGRVRFVGCSGHPDQLWRLVENGWGSPSQLRNVATGKCLNVYSGRDNREGGGVTVFSCADSQDQRWSFFG